MNGLDDLRGDYRFSGLGSISYRLPYKMGR